MILVNFSLILLTTGLILSCHGQRPIVTYTTARTATVTQKPWNSGPGLRTTGKPTTTTTTTAAPTMGNLTFVISGSKIPTSDPASMVDGFVKVFSKTASAGGEVEMGMTEVIDDNENPQWTKVFWYLWKKGTGQKWRFVVQDHDTLGRNDDVGEVIVDVDDYVLQKKQDITVNLGPLTGTTSTGPVSGSLTIKKTEPTSFKLYARNVPKKDSFGGKSDPYVDIFWRRGKTGADIPLGSTSVKSDEENPDWPEIFEFSNYQKGTNQYWFFKVQDQDSLTSSDNLGDLLVEVDPFVMKRQTKITKLDNSDGQATLAVIPA